MKVLMEMILLKIKFSAKKALKSHNDNAFRTFQWPFWTFDLKINTAQDESAVKCVQQPLCSRILG